MTGLPAEWCWVAARERGDDLVGTAPRADRWLLVEQPGPWGRDALRESRLARAAAERVTCVAGELGARVAVVRRPGRSEDRERLWALVDCRRQTWLHGRWLHEDALVDGVEQAAGAPDGAGEKCPQLWLVCTHGRHDRCCAVRGRPVAAALAALHPAGEGAPEVWECSHVGGDRFAGNVVQLPTGTYYGWVEPEDAGRLLAVHAAGRVDVERWRGRSTLPPAVQAAQQHLRRQRGLDRLDDLAPLGCERSGEGWRVRLDAGGEVVDVELRQESGPSAAHLTCAARAAAAPARWKVTAIRAFSEIPPMGIVTST
ncbi:MAG: sucrase ferredoxin [Motilibacteraceae bacterium]